MLDGINYQISIPEEKIIKASNQLQYMLSRKKATVQELQGLAGLLNFMTRAIFPGRAFTQRMYAKFAPIMSTLKEFHHI